MSRRKSGNCPKKEDFVRAVQGKIADDSRPEFFRHVLRCPCCRPKLQILAKIKAELEAREDRVPESGLTREETRALRRVAVGQIRLIKPGDRRFSFRPFPVVAAVVIPVIALALGYLLLNSTLHSRSVMRGPINLELRLLVPGPHLKGAPADFSWSDVPGRDDFRFVLVDDDLNTLYETVTEDTSLRLPEKERVKLLSGRAYLWTVLALDDNNRELASSSRVLEIE